MKLPVVTFLYTKRKSKGADYMTHIKIIKNTRIRILLLQIIYRAYSCLEEFGP